MHKAGFLFSVLLLAGLGSAMGQKVPDPSPENNPDAKALADKLYPSAKVCGDCHPKQYEEWRVSSHAYADLSPMFNKFEQKINDLAHGTINYFCVRCHATTGTALGERRDIPWWDRSASGREGITCVTCHRVGEAYGKVNGARRIAPGDIHLSVFGPFDGEGVLEAIEHAEKFKLLVSPDEPDKKGYLRIHQQGIKSDLIVKSEFCTACHQVAVYAGIKLETVWEEYRASPAAKENITCQDCHMNPNPGTPRSISNNAAGPQNISDDPSCPFSADAPGPAALIQKKWTVDKQRMMTDHTFVGPGYPISHPGLFPLNDSRFTPQQWLTFDWRADWGKDDFEAKVAAHQDSTKFPPEWQKLDDRKEAWGTVQANRDLWKCRLKKRLKLLANGSRLDGPFFVSRPAVGKPLAFHYQLTNLNKGHNLPSGSLGAQPELWLNVALIDPDGKIVWETGALDSYGDLRDLQSEDVRKHKLPLDSELFSMQSKFITTNLKGTDREMYLPVNFDVDQLPFIRPGGTPVSLLNHPPNVRLEKRSIPPLGTREARFKVPADKLTKAGTYKLAVRLRGRSEPIYFMKFVGATDEMLRTENEWITDTHAYQVEFAVR
jgi:nitrate/TMAO reductase-like tetraheme cytochrome c subunit